MTNQNPANRYARRNDPSKGIDDHLPTTGRLSLISVIALMTLASPRTIRAEDSIATSNTKADQLPPEDMDRAGDLTYQNSALMLEYIAGAPVNLNSAARDSVDARMTVALQLAELQQHSCGRVSEQADAIAGYTLICPSLLSPLGHNLNECNFFDRALAMRHITSVARHTSNDPSCTAARVANDQIASVARLWSIEQWPAASEYPDYDTEDGQAWDPRMILGFAWSTGERDANLLRLLLDTSLALWVAENSLAHHNLKEQPELVQDEQRTETEIVPALSDDSYFGATARRTACRIIRANLSELDGRVHDAILAPLVFATQNPAVLQPSYVPICHLSSEFSGERMVEFISMMDTPALRRAPAPLKAWAVQGASSYFTEWAQSSHENEYLTDSVTMGFLRAVDDLADHYLNHHRDSSYNPDLEIPLNADLLELALDLTNVRRGPQDYAALQPVIAPSLIAALYVMERDELRLVRVTLAPDSSGDELAADLRTPQTRWVVPWQVPEKSAQTTETEKSVHDDSMNMGALDHEYSLKGGAFAPNAVFASFCRGGEVKFKPTEPPKYKQTLLDEKAKQALLNDDAAEALMNMNEAMANIADLRAANWADVSCAAFAPQPQRDGQSDEFIAVWRAAKSTYYMVVVFPELVPAVRDLIPGTTHNLSLSPTTVSQSSAPDTTECIWTDRPARDVIEALGFDRVGMALHAHARQALHANGTELRSYRDAATRAYACEAVWMEANDLNDFARFVNQKSTLPGAPACERRRPADVEPSRADTSGRVTYVAVRKYAHPMRHLGELPEDQILAGVLMNDILGRAGAEAFPLNECSAWELEDDEGGQILIGVRAPMGMWTEIREDGIIKAWNFEHSPTWNPPRIDKAGGGVDPEDLLVLDSLSANADRRSPSSPHQETPSTSKNALVDTRRSWLLASGVGAGIAGVTLLTDGGIRLGRNATLYGSTLDAQQMLTPVQYADDLHTARSGQLVGGVELIAGAALVGTSVWCLSTLVNHNLPISQREQEYGLTLAATWLPATGGFIAFHAPIGGARD